MTIEEAKEEIPTFDVFRKMLCSACVGNDWYCPTNCPNLDKAERIFLRVQDAYARHDGDLKKVLSYIRNTKK